jgi:LysM repeat protein
MTAASLAAGTLLLGSLAASAGPGRLVYTIAWGDTLSELAERFDSDTTTLAQQNALDDPDLIITGQDLVIWPGEPEEDATREIHQEYVVQEGDTLGSIAADHDTDQETLATLNQLSDPNLIVVGQTLLLPNQSAAAEIVEADLPQEDTAEEPVEESTVVAETVEGEAADDQVDDASVAEEPVADDSGASADGEADETAEAEDVTEADEATEANPAEADAQEPAPVAVVEDETGDEGAGEADAVEISPATDPISRKLHLVLPGETIAGIAEQYGLSELQLMAANGHAQDGIVPGMILKIPDAETSMIGLIGMPAGFEPTPIASELAAAALAVSYWGGQVTVEDLAAGIPPSDNPHAGFRGDINGMWGRTDDYGVYAEPIAAYLSEQGFLAEVFYGDAEALKSRVAAGVPVVVWVTYQLADQVPVVVEEEAGSYTLIPEKHALVVYGYDDAGVYVVDVSLGDYVRLPWDAFLNSWGYFDGMGLAISPE